MKTSKRADASRSDLQIGLFQVQETPRSYRKAVEVVHSKPRAPMSLLQRKLANAWLKNAVDNRPDHDGWWTIGIGEMSQHIGFDSNNREYLKESARDLMRIIFEWDVISPAARRASWKASVLFPDVEIRSDVMRYQISKPLRDSVLNPDIYALIDLNVVRKFRRAPSLAIYEHCVRFEKIGRTTPVPWKEFRDIVLGESADAPSYSEFKFFRSKVLVPSIAEINSVSDIQVTLEQSKIGKSVSTLQFTVEKKPSLEIIEPTDERTQEAVGEMVEMGIPQSEAKRLAKKHGHERIRSAVTYTRKRVADKKAAKIENQAAYLRMALSHDWGAVEDVTIKGRSAKPDSRTAANKLMDDFMVGQIGQAERYFKELDAADQGLLIGRYNDQQKIKSLHVKSSRITKGAQTAFFGWLALDTWGKPTTEQLLEFAQTLLADRAAS